LAISLFRRYAPQQVDRAKASRGFSTWDNPVPGYRRPDRYGMVRADPWTRLRWCGDSDPRTGQGLQFANPACGLRPFYTPSGRL